MKDKTPAALLEDVIKADCWVCDQNARSAFTNATGEVTWVGKMLVCSNCGNKRCPKATNHDYGCSNSNEPGQQGSVHR